jgi:hypothetical protein
MVASSFRVETYKEYELKLIEDALKMSGAHNQVQNMSHKKVPMESISKRISTILRKSSSGKGT